MLLNGIDELRLTMSLYQKPFVSSADINDLPVNIQRTLLIGCNQC